MNTPHLRLRRVIPLAAAGGLAVVGLSAGTASAATTGPPAPTISIPVLPGVIGHITLSIAPCIRVQVGDGHTASPTGLPPDPVKIAVINNIGGVPNIHLDIAPCI
jgi:hypothetical protein